MDKRHTKPYKGMIFDIEDPHLDLDFKKYMNPGELTIFTMTNLKAGEYDIAIKCIVDCMFRIKWEESTELKMIVVFDEVHRLLEKYGGIGGYISLEKACREFRKWGIGVIMCSQVLADFKEAIAGNVLTDIQLNTKSLVDIGKVKEKYGPIYAQRVSRQGIAVGMIQHPRYNEGKPWFINFRPPYHNPHKISNEEMKMYKEFAAKLDSIEMRIEIMKREGKDVFDIELELKLAKDKLKQGRFRMAKIYIESLEKYFR
ncbi:MAG: ATP-binding protein [Candidatus Aenigmatarchaeota archaeon]|nr:MAG: ATP-binding protein [Candidatus Aenigmarchaeota archaeon]